MRRSFALIVACVAMLAAQAQPADGKHRVGVLVPAATPDIAEFQRALKELGYIEGDNLSLVVRIAGDRLDKLSSMAAEIVKGSPEAILAVNTPGTRAAMAATKTIPIVMVAVGDPLGMKFTGSLARPDRNVTGVTNQCGELAGKRLDVFKETLPHARRLAIMYNVADPITEPQLRDAEKTAPTLDIEVRRFPLRAKEDMDASFDALLKWRADGIFWLCGQQRSLTRQVLPLATRHRVPVMAYQSVEVPAGALLSYSTENADLFRRAATYVDKILKGAKVADLPVEQPTKFELVINMKTAAALGITIPQSVLVRADRIIR